MKFKISYYQDDSFQLRTKVLQATTEKAALAIFHDVYGGNRDCEIINVSPQSDFESADHIISQDSTDDLSRQSADEKKKGPLINSSVSKNLSGSSEALALASEAADKLTAYKAKKKPKEQEHIWFYTVDSENIAGPVVLASIQNKVDEGILQEDSLVMKTGGDWMTVSKFKKMDTSSVAAAPSFRTIQTNSSTSSPISTTATLPTKVPYPQPSSVSTSTPTAAPKKYPSLVFSFWVIYVIGGFIVVLISGPLSSSLAAQNGLDIVEELGLKLDIMVGISFFYTMFAVLIVYLSSTEYKVKNNGFSWHYLAQAIVFLQGLVSLSFALHRL